MVNPRMVYIARFRFSYISLFIIYNIDEYKIHAKKSKQLKGRLR
jgi:hypothetical protein